MVAADVPVSTLPFGNNETLFAAAAVGNRFIGFALELLWKLLSQRSVPDFPEKLAVFHKYGALSFILHNRFKNCSFRQH